MAAILRAGDGSDAANHIAVTTLASAEPGGSGTLRPNDSEGSAAASNPAPGPGATIVLSSPPNAASVSDVQESLGQVLQQMVGTTSPLPSPVPFVASPPSVSTSALRQHSRCRVHWTCTQSVLCGML